MPIGKGIHRVAPAIILGLSLFLAACGGPTPKAKAPPGPIPGSEVMAATQVDRMAPPFTLTDQFGRKVSLRELRGKVILLAFIDSQCTGICPMTTASLVGAVDRLGAAARHVQLVAVNANPIATSVQDVRAYSVAHGVLHRWLFLTGSPAALRAVWKDYGIVAVPNSTSVEHTAAVYLIDEHGRERVIYISSRNYADIAQESIGFAQAAADILGPGVKVNTDASRLATEHVSLTKAITLRALLPGRPSIRLGPGSAHLTVFFASWVPGAATGLAALETYQRQAAAQGLPGLVAIDVGSVEPGPTEAAVLIRSLGAPLDYPVALDPTGAVADGYFVNSDLPWLTLSSAQGTVLWEHDGFLAPKALLTAVAKALGK